MKTITPKALEAIKQTLTEAKEALEHVSKDCDMALDGEWDKSDDGFEAMQDNVDSALKNINNLLEDL